MERDILLRGLHNLCKTKIILTKLHLVTLLYKHRRAEAIKSSMQIFRESDYDILILSFAQINRPASRTTQMETVEGHL